MRLAIDMTVLRQAPHAGTARYAREAFAAMAAAPPPGAVILPVSGWPRWRAAARLRPVQRLANLGLDAGWLAGGALAAAARTITVPMTAPVSLQLLALAIGLALLGGLLAGTLGGWRAARLRPAEALRRVE